MRRDGAAVVLVALGVLGLRLALTDAMLDYVRAWMRWPILATSLLLIVLGILELLGALSGRRSPVGDGAEAAGHAHGGNRHGPAVTWLLIAPVVVTLVVAPGALEADAVYRALPAAPIPLEEIPPLPVPVDGHYELPLAEFVARAVGPEGGLEGLPVRLVGFVVRRGGDVSMARFRISCCAADAQVAEIRLGGVADAPDQDTWVVVEGRWVSTGPGGDAAMQVERLAPIVRPTNPYE